MPRTQHCTSYKEGFTCIRYNDLRDLTEKHLKFCNYEEINPKLTPSVGKELDSRTSKYYKLKQNLTYKYVVFGNEHNKDFSI